MWVMGTVGRDGVEKSGGFLVGGEVPLEVTLERRVKVPLVRRGRIMLLLDNISQ